MTPDPLAHIQPGDPADTSDVLTPCFAAYLHGAAICTRERHPREWQHIADDGNRVLATWNET